MLKVIIVVISLFSVASLFCSVKLGQTADNEMKNIMSNWPLKCPITGIKINNEFSISSHEGPVYGDSKKGFLYTLPYYDKETQTFVRIKVDMKNNRKTSEKICTIDDLKDRSDFEQIKNFYGI